MEKGLSVFSEDKPLILEISLGIGLIFLLAALGIALWRIARADSAFDRVVALDLIGGICLCFLVLIAIGFKQAIFLDSAFALAVVSYLGTVALARYLERGKMR
jgi:multisubunit Na+/H+ antiporter MnhF subunit